jgi:hypothetical protein
MTKSFALLTRISVLALLALPFGVAHAGSLECANWQSQHPDWLWCDDFESDSSLTQNYFDVNRVGGRFGVTSQSAFGGNGSLKATYAVGQEDAGGIKLSLGKTLASPARYTDRNFDELYWRFYLKTSPNWVGQPMKLTRATIFTAANWQQAAIGHLWQDSALGLGLDPATGVSGSSVVTTGWNDFAHLRWLGKVDGHTQIYSAANRDKWFCVEVHMKLNTPGQSDGTFGFSINGASEAQETGLNWRGSYTTYGINAIMLENWINGGATQSQDRYMDNFVVSTRPIGCQSDVRPNPPTDIRAQ